MAGDAETFLTDYCGINLYNADTGALVGWDAGGASIRTADSIVPESGTASAPSGSSFTSSGLTITFGSNLTSGQQVILNGLYSWWVGNSLDLINETYGYGFSSGSTSFNSMPLNFTNANDGTLAYVSSSYAEGNRQAAESELVVNMAYYGSVSADDPNGNTADGGYLDRTLAHELTHAVQAATFGQLPVFFTEGLAELTCGIDDERRSSLVSLAGDTSYLQGYTNAAIAGETLDADGYAVGFGWYRLPDIPES